VQTSLRGEKDCQRATRGGGGNKRTDEVERKNPVGGGRIAAGQGRYCRIVEIYAISNYRIKASEITPPAGHGGKRRKGKEKRKLSPVIVFIEGAIALKGKVRVQSQHSELCGKKSSKRKTCIGEYKCRNQGWTRPENQTKADTSYLDEGGTSRGRSVEKKTIGKYRQSKNWNENPVPN